MTSYTKVGSFKQVTLLAADSYYGGLMVIEPYLNRAAKKIIAEDEQKIESYAEVSDLNTLIGSLNTEIKNRKRGKKNSSGRKIATYAILEKVYNLFASPGDVQIKKILCIAGQRAQSTWVLCQSLQSFNNIKNIIYADEDISLNLSMETEITDSGLYTGRVSFTDRKFQPLDHWADGEKSK